MSAGLRALQVGNPQLGWRLCFLMALCLYVGNAMKDLISAPRPTGMTKGKQTPVLLALSNDQEAAVNMLVCLALLSVQSEWLLMQTPHCKTTYLLHILLGLRVFQFDTPNM